ncbi:hypothetical protein LWI29_027833 [Acer saccharum]|uniref:Reverse transcriptase zinc-binding domain-containing protein n=1 Tax=Acer saccharum TaxID=4024 RepID=A0AA39W7R5_ACESA|nr:hypothetical protein LWI29_027833 [Acer saccharum]
MREQFSKSIAWSGCSNGLFTVGSFRKGLEDNRNNIIMDFKGIWQGICLPKIEIFLWQLLRGRVLVKEVINKCGLEQISDIGCPFCEYELETIDHAFLHCRWSMFVWEECMNWCHNRNFNGWFEGWRGCCLSPKSKKIWCSLLFAVSWTIWKCRNQLVFEGNRLSTEQAINMIKFRIVWWFKHFKKGST